MGSFRYAFHIGWARPGINMVGGWRRIVGPIWFWLSDDIEKNCTHGEEMMIPPNGACSCDTCVARRERDAEKAKADHFFRATCLPVLESIAAKHGMEVARQMMKTAAIKAGFNPDDFDLFRVQKS